MSPEQATADRDLSARSDVYALACVMYEMLAGATPHAAPTAQAILMKILTEEARPVTDLRKAVPEHVESALAKALQKLPADRFERAEAFRKAIEDTEYRYTPPVRTSTSAAVVEVKQVRSGVPGWMAAAIGVVMLAMGFVVSRATHPEAPFAPSAEFRLVPDSSHIAVAPCCGRSVAISEAGDRVVYQGFDGRNIMLYQRPLDQREARVIPGTEGARHPFFSPNGEWVGFWVGESILKVRFDGGTPLSVSSGLGRVAGGDWALDNTIVYSVRGALEVLYRVSADGGVPETLTTVDTTRGERAHRWPHVLLDGKTVVFSIAVLDGGGSFGETLGVTSLEGGGHEHLAPGADPRYVEPGYLVYSDAAGSIMAQPFDGSAGEFTGARFRIAERATYRGGQSAVSEYDISRNATLVFRESASVGSGGQEDLVLVDMAGNAEVLHTTGPMRQPRFSPDGRYIAYEAEADSDENDDIWVWDQNRANAIRVTFENDNSLPTWSADGSRILFESGSTLFSRAADGSGQTELIHVIGAGVVFPFAAKDGSWLLWSQPAEGGHDIWGMTLDPPGEARPIIQSQYAEFSPAISPDGRWLAYVAQDAGDDVVYVEPFPDRGPRFKVSTGRGRAPVWAPDGSKLYYRIEGSPDQLVAVEVFPGDRFDVGEHVVLFESDEYEGSTNGTNYDIHPDGDRFVFISGGSSLRNQAGPRNVVITNALNAGGRD